MYSYPNEYGSDTEEDDDRNDEYMDEETRIDRILDLYQSLQTKRCAELEMFDQLKSKLESLTADIIPYDILKYIILPYVGVVDYPEIPELTQVEIVPDTNTPQLDE